MSVINTCALLGINLKLFPKEIDNSFSVPKGTGTLKHLTDDIDAVIITSPNYYGICSDIKNTAEECHAKISLYLLTRRTEHTLSQAIYFRKPQNIRAQYAKVLTKRLCNERKFVSSINGDLIDRKRLEKSLYMFQSSSPSYVIASSADIARDELTDGGMW